MSKKILVTYGTKKGTTGEIAEEIRKTLAESGYSVEMLEAGRVSSLEGYSAVVTGSSLYMGQWNKRVVSLLNQNVDRLKDLPVWIFISGPTGDGDPNEQLKDALYPKSLKPAIDLINPREIMCFGGKLDPDTMNFFEKWIIKNVKAPVGDFRDWAKIEEWAENISGQLKD